MLTVNSHIFSRFGGTRFLLTLGCGFVCTGLLCFHFIDQSTFKDIILGTVGAFIVSHTAQNIFSNKSEGGFGQ
jgi:uncharacterized membrane protein YeaQ/YmgE (transglycosylase-associated protein family)